MSELAPPHDDDQPRKRKLGPIIGAATAGVLTGGALVYGLAVKPYPSTFVTVAGAVTCPKGEPVTGVWVEPHSGKGRGWAEWHSSSDQPNIANYSKDIDAAATSYEVNAGCGGSPTQWEHTDYSPPIANSTELMSVTCTDQTGIKIGSCVVAPLTR
jgi:hypothetical protein